MTIDLVLGPRPDEPGPPIAGPAAYPDDVTDRLAADAAVIIAGRFKLRTGRKPDRVEDVIERDPRGEAVLKHPVTGGDSFQCDANIVVAGRLVAR